MMSLFSSVICAGHALLLCGVVLHAPDSKAASAEGTKGTPADQSASWLRYPPSGLACFSLEGEFADTDLFTRKFAYSAEAVETAKTLVADTVFLVKHAEGNYTLWAALLRMEDKFPADEVPQFPTIDTLTLTECAKKYGPPTSTGRFQLPDGDKLLVYWWGPVCMMARTAGTNYWVVGGWPSRLLERQTPADFTTAFKKNAQWPLLRESVRGEYEVRIVNPNADFVKVGLRSFDKGKDFVVEPRKSGFVRVPDGKYDIYFQYSSDAHSLYQGDSFTITNTGVTIQLVTVVNGNYGIRKVK